MPSTDAVARIAHPTDRITLVRADLLAELSCVSATAEVAPTEVYDLAAQGLLSTTWRQPVLTAS